MGLFGRLSGMEPPKVPTGARLVICDNQASGPMGRSFVWWVAYVLPGDDPNDVSKQHRCSQEFTELVSAQAWRDFIQDPKGKAFRYPTGPV